MLGEIFIKVAVILSLVGVVFVNKKMWQGQLIWSISNVILIVYNFSQSEFEQSFLFLVYLWFSVWATIGWRRQCREN